MDNLLDRYQVPKLNQYQINNLNNPTHLKKQKKSLIVSQPIKAQDQMGSMQTFKEDLTILFKLFEGNRRNTTQLIF